MKAETKKYLIYGGVAVLVGSLGYFVYSTIFVKKPSVVDKATVESDEEKETPSKPNPFTALLNNPLPTSIGYTPKSFSSTNPFANVNTAIAGFNPMQSSSDRIV